MGKGLEILRCLGYLHSSYDDDDDDTNAEHDSLCVSKGARAQFIKSPVVDMWHLRTLAIQPGGLMDIQARKLSWIKLAGVDELVFTNDDKNIHASKNGSGGDIAFDTDRTTYEQIQAYFEREMEVSKWHIQREQRRLRNGKKTSSEVALSCASSANDLSSIASHVSESSTPLTANLHGSQHHHNCIAGTPKSETFLSYDGINGASSNAVSSFTAFPTKRNKDSSTPLSITISCPSLIEAVTFDNDDTDSSSPSSINLSSTPPPLPATNPPKSHLSDQFLWHKQQMSSYHQYSQRYQLRNSHKQPMSIKSNIKKDRRSQERKLLIQIASSTVNLLQCSSLTQDDEYDEFRYYSGMQDLIAILLLHLESPSLTSLVMKQIWTSHLRMYFRRLPPKNDENDECQSFTSFIDCKNTITPEVTQPLRMVSRYFHLLQVLDEELYDSISHVGMGQWVVCKEIHKWIVSWFCCHDTLPLHVISRVVDFFLASHPMMPL